MAGYDVCPTEVQELLVPWLKSMADGDNRIMRNIRKRMLRLRNIQTMHEGKRMGQFSCLAIEGEQM